MPFVAVRSGPSTSQIFLLRKGILALRHAHAAMIIGGSRLRRCHRQKISGEPSVSGDVRSPGPGTANPAPARSAASSPSPARCASKSTGTANVPRRAGADAGLGVPALRRGRPRPARRGIGRRARGRRARRPVGHARLHHDVHPQQRRRRTGDPGRCGPAGDRLHHRVADRLGDGLRALAAARRAGRQHRLATGRGARSRLARGAVGDHARRGHRRPTGQHAARHRGGPPPGVAARPAESRHLLRRTLAGRPRG